MPASRQRREGFLLRLRAVAARTAKKARRRRRGAPFREDPVAGVWVRYDEEQKGGGKSAASGCEESSRRRARAKA